MNTQTYLGDGVYAGHDGHQFVLAANDPDDPSDVVYLPDEVCTALLGFVEAVRAGQAGAPVGEIAAGQDETPLLQVDFAERDFQVGQRYLAVLEDCCLSGFVYLGAYLGKSADEDSLFAHGCLGPQWGRWAVLPVRSAEPKEWAVVLGEAYLHEWARLAVPGLPG